MLRIVNLMIIITATCFYVVMSRGGDLPRQVTGNPRVDFFPMTIRYSSERTMFQKILNDTTPILLETDAQAKSPWLAGALSLALPGAGELYSESYLKSGLFFAAEAVAWIVAYAYDKKGDRQTDVFQNFADEHWSVVDYAMWLNTYRGTNIAISSNTALPPWERVNWGQLNDAERQVASGPQGYGFTHILSFHGEQQYYELIGKYDQYSTGWDDFPPQEQDFFKLSPRFKEYSQMRGKANDYYNIASTALSIIVVNHILSAVDAYFTATSFNRALHVEAKLNMRYTPFGVVAEPAGVVKITF